jgi:hypothetical protein
MIIMIEAKNTHPRPVRGSTWVTGIGLASGIMTGVAPFWVCICWDIAILLSAEGHPLLPAPLGALRA